MKLNDILNSIKGENNQLELVVDLLYSHPNLLKKLTAKESKLRTSIESCLILKTDNSYENFRLNLCDFFRSLERYSTGYRDPKTVKNENFKLPSKRNDKPKDDFIYYHIGFSLKKILVKKQQTIIHYDPTAWNFISQISYNTNGNSGKSEVGLSRLYCMWLELLGFKVPERKLRDIKYKTRKNKLVKIQ